MQNNLVEPAPLVTPPLTGNGSPTMGKHALEYAQRGWPVLPLHTPLDTRLCSCGNDDCQSIGKHPRIRNGCKGATTESDIIEQWWEAWPNANIGIATGTASGLVVLDVDPDREGDKALAELENRNGTLPDTLQSKTGSGGWHYLFSQSETVIRNSAGKIGEGLDIRGDGGYIVAPPSLHMSGEHYEWKNENALHAIPTWLVASATAEKKPQVEKEKAKAPVLTEHPLITQGERNDKLFKITCGLRSHGLNESELLAALRQINEERCEPPLEDNELQIISKSACRYEAEDSADLRVREPLIRSWEEFSTTEIPEGEKILRELERGEVGMLVAATNIGKTTLSLNLALSLAAGRSFLPIAKGDTKGMKVLYVDGETRPARLQRDLFNMQRYFSRRERESVKQNLLIVCDAELDGLPLNLSDDRHMQVVKREGSTFEPDLIVVDTLSALFDLQAENDNAEISKRVMKPLASLARETNAAILLLHHIGKQSEDAQAGIKAYRGRGASALGAAARYVLVLTPHPNASSRVVLTCAKSKGITFPDMVMKLDSDSRWFSTTGEDAPRTQSTYERVVEAVKKLNGEAQRKEIEKALKPLSSSTIGRHLTTATNLGELRLVRYGVYALPELAHLPNAIDDDQVTN